MTSIQLDNNYPEDERWLEAGAVAFALHVAACCYSDRMDKDGLVPKSIVGRVAIMVPPSQVESAVESLVESGFWSSAGRNYRINNYLEDKIGLSAEEKISTRNKWAENKRLRRQHLNGNHEACNPKACKQAGVSTVDSTVDSAMESTSMSTGSPGRSTLPDKTLPDPTPVGGRGEGRGRRPSGPASAGAPASPRSSRTGGGAPRPDADVDGLDPEIYGRNPQAMTPDQLARVEEIMARMDADDDPAADTLEGLIPAGGAAG